MNYYRVPTFLTVKYREYTSLEQMVEFSFHHQFNTLQTVGLQILTQGVNNVTLAVI